MALSLALDRRFQALVVVLVAISMCASGTTVQADSTYGLGTYGSCDYNSCGISLTSSGNVSINVTPGSGTTCTLNSDTVSVLTDASTGYTLQISDGDTVNQLSGAAHGGTIPAVSGSAATPALFTANTWGYRVDGAGGFGTGPTSSESNGTIPSVTFAAPPLSSGTPDTIATTSSAADPAVNTTVWFGACANTTLPADTYTDSVTYTAVTN